MADADDGPGEVDGVFALPRGATGFLRPQEGLPLPETDPRAFRAALYAAARAACGRVGEVEERAYPRTFHTASVGVHGGAAERTEHIVLCHAHLPWVAFVRERRDWYADPDGFLDAPPWAGAFAAAGFTVLTGGQLAVPLAGVDTAVLSPVEWRQVRLYGVTTLGGLLFNAWD
ncbi:hypothetical protein ACFV7Q_29615 [Streptomyces sp. NPDC059851]|uniref:hypothetical protein n=1 Tax=Streptomyces sp. NPDC059851 TaxID=3346971 RepID=UPI003667E42C